MAIPRYWAKDIWLAAIGQITGNDPGDIDPTENWDTYMSKAQLGAAFDLTNAGLLGQGYTTTWKLMSLAATNPIDKQIDLLAASTNKAGPPQALHESLARFAKRRSQ